jgi:hypothetical protein
MGSRSDNYCYKLHYFVKKNLPRLMNLLIHESAVNCCNAISLLGRRRFSCCMLCDVENELCIEVTSHVHNYSSDVQ